MFTKIENALTFGGQYITASVIYFGLTLILAGTVLFDAQQLRATDEQSGCTYTVDEDHEGTIIPVTYDGCPEGQQCCGGECIPDSEVCCDDGTHGDADSCVCCADCNDESDCEKPVSTIKCE